MVSKDTKVRRPTDEAEKGTKRKRDAESVPSIESKRKRGGQPGNSNAAKPHPSMEGNLHAAKHLQRSRDEAMQAAVAGLPKSRAEALVTALTSRDLGDLAEVAAKAALEAEGLETENESKIVGIRSRQPSTHHHRHQHTNERIGEERELQDTIERARVWQLRGPVGWVVIHRQWLTTIVELLDYLDAMSPEEIEEMYVPGVNGKRRSPAGFLNGMLHRDICEAQIIDAQTEELKCPKSPICTWWAGQRRFRMQEQTS